jgi:hypothetical protein
MPRETAAGYLRWIDAIDRGMRLLQLLAPDKSGEEARQEGNENVVGRYNPETQTVQLVEQPEQPAWMNMLVLAHEYTHSLQQVETDAAPELEHAFARDKVWQDRKSSARQAVSAYVEGEAQLYSFLTYAFMRRVDVHSWAMEEYLQFLQKRMLAEVVEAESRFAVARASFHYPVGFRRLWQLWSAEGQVGVREKAKQLDLSFSQWLEAYPLTSGRSETPQNYRCGHAEPPNGYEKVVDDALGPSGVAAIVVPALEQSLGLPLQSVWEHASALAGDHLRIYTEIDPEIPPVLYEFPELIEGGQVTVLWDLWFYEEAAAASFEKLVKSFPELSVNREGTHVGILGETSTSGKNFGPSPCDAG